MKEIIEAFLYEILGKELSVFICSMLPVIELRGSIPMAFALGMPWWESYIISVIGNMIPVPIILIVINSLLKWMSASKIKLCNIFANFLLGKIEKNRARIEKYSFWGLCFFVAIPLPATGAWTGAMVAATIGLKPWKAILSTFLGVLIAGAIVTLIVYGGIGFLAWLL
jgi:uncharacterized membrane protein